MFYLRNFVAAVLITTTLYTGAIKAADAKLPEADCWQSKQWHNGQYGPQAGE